MTHALGWLREKGRVNKESRNEAKRRIDDADTRAGKLESRLAALQVIVDTARTNSAAK